MSTPSHRKENHHVARDVARCTAEIDLAALRYNLQQVRSSLSAGVRIAAVLKADAYGHGLKALAAFLKTEADLFGVANLAEAREIREVVPNGRVLILGPALPRERHAIIRDQFEAVVSSLKEAQSYAEAAQAEGKEARLHLAVDSGMGRIGVWHSDALELAEAIAALSGVRLIGIGSHLPSADCDQRWTEEEQLTAWQKLIASVRASDKLQGVEVHLLNSAGILLYGDQAALAGDFVRAGLMLYGSAPMPEHQRQLRPVMTLKTAISLIRDVPTGRGVSYGRTFITPEPMRIGTLAAGYGDGYPRHLSGGAKAEVLVRGRRCAVLGRVTMDQVLIDLSAVPEAMEGDEVILIGRQGQEEITAAELADKAGTIAWEIFTGITRRVARVYRDSDRE